MPSDISADWSELVKQSQDTAETYFNRALRILKDSDLAYEAADVVALAAVMADDFRTAGIGVAAERLDAAIRGHAESLAEALRDR